MNEHEIIYDSQREQTLNLYSQLQVLEDEGKDVGELKEEAFQKLVGYAEEDSEEKLHRLRSVLHRLTDSRKEPHSWKKTQ